MNIPFENEGQEDATTNQYIPFKSQKDYTTTNQYIGNAGAGYNVNKPTIPIINYNNDTKFTVGIYNNNTMDTLPNNYTDYSNLKYHTNNPINGNNWVCNNNLNSNGSNGRSLNPNPWVKYNLKDSYIPNTPQNSQTFAYNRNSSFLDGGIKRQWGGFYSVNISDNNLEQIETREGITPNEQTQEEDDAVNELLKEMNNTEAQWITN
jgi:hypothetical protein